MRTLLSASTVSAAAAASLLLAPAAYATTPGDNGTVKIHDAETGEDLKKNEPHVCTFYLDAFGFDSGQQVDWHIEAWAPTADVKGETVKSDSLTLDGAGHKRTVDMTLPDGHYKLFWNFDGENGSAKHKVFWTDCEEGEEEGEEPGGGESSSGASDEPTTMPTGRAGDDSSAAPGEAASPNGNGGGDLAETGASIGIPAAIAALLLGSGAFLLRRRGRQQH
jgi:LPXTG-motif cell wall-anchored protein